MCGLCSAVNPTLPELRISLLSAFQIVLAMHAAQLAAVA